MMIILKGSQFYDYCQWVFVGTEYLARRQFNGQHMEAHRRYIKRQHRHSIYRRSASSTKYRYDV